MPAYTFFRIDPDGRIVERFDRERSSDAEALSAAKKLAGEGGIEVWLGPRKVGEFRD